MGPWGVGEASAKLPSRESNRERGPRPKLRGGGGGGGGRTQTGLRGLEPNLERLAG
jgi:hypothetical protein